MLEAGLSTEALEIVPLGGVGEFGMNMMAVSCAGTTIVIDAGAMFPGPELLGVDLIVPDLSYLQERRVAALVLTHGHEDHIGGVPYVWPLVDGPVLVLDLALVHSGSINTNKVEPLDEGRTVYTERRLIAQWGTLEVSGGALLEDSSTRRGSVSLRRAAADHRSGEGWTLDLAPGWTIVAGERAGDFVVSKER